jgi:hypothetical protein
MLCRIINSDIRTSNRATRMLCSLLANKQKYLINGFWYQKLVIQNYPNKIAIANISALVSIKSKNIFNKIFSTPPSLKNI